MTTDLPLLPTTVVGSYSVPHWLERLKTDAHRGQISAGQLESIHDVAIKAAVKDQEIAGIDIVSDGELRRDNDVDYILERLPGITLPASKSFYYDYYEAAVTSALATENTAALGFADQFRFTDEHTAAPIVFSFTSPFAVSCRLRNEFYPNRRELVLAIAHLLNAEAQALAAAGATRIQIDEPFLAGYPEEVELAIEAVNIVTKDVDVHWILHVCYGNRYARPSWEGHYDFLFPAVLGADIAQLTLEFARKGYDDLRLVTANGWDRAIGIGVIDVKSRQVESQELVESRLRRVLDVVPPERVVINPDCGLRHLPGEVARAKLDTMVRATRAIRAELSVPPQTPVLIHPSTQAATPVAAEEN